MSRMILFEGATYFCGDDCCTLRSLEVFLDRFVVPSAIYTTEGKKYRVKGITPSPLDPAIVPKGCSAGVISFDESSEITEIPLSFIGRCRSVFFLPPQTRRIVGSRPDCFPKIVSDKRRQRYVSTPGSRVIMNHFPLEVTYQHSSRFRFSIRESVRFVGDLSFYQNMSIVSVVFPSSVESIGCLSFFGCHNLRHISFKKNSRLKIIGYSSFMKTAVESVDIPSNVEEIGSFAFYNCKSLRSVTFHEDSKLKKIGHESFESAAIESVDIPSCVEEIGSFTFYDCKRLRSVRYLNEETRKNINEDIFYGCSNLIH